MRKFIPWLFVLVMFHRVDGHIVWVNPDQVVMVQGAGQIGYTTGTLINTTNEHVTVNEDVNEVVRALRAVEEKCKSPT